jgi:hypothetical protein
MPLAQAEPTSVEEFLAWKRCPGFRYGFNGVRPTAMTGAMRSTSTDLIDRNVKADECGAPSSIGRHVVLAHIAAEATILSRAGGAWARGRPSGRDAILQLTEFNVALPPAGVYRRIVLND